MKKIVGIYALFALMSLLVACGGSGGTGGATPTSGTTPTPSGSATATPTNGNVATTTAGGNDVIDLAATSFVPNSVTIKKGESIVLKNQTSTVHIISNGSWSGNMPAPKTEGGAPVASGLTFNTANESKTIGPFNTAGTFHYYCSVHPGMNLVVIVN